MQFGGFGIKILYEFVYLFSKIKKYLANLYPSPQGAKYLENIPNSHGWYLTDGMLYNNHGYDYYVAAPGEMLDFPSAHRYCDSLGARLWCPDHPDEMEAVEISFRKKLNFTVWKTDPTQGFATGLAFVPEEPEKAFCYSEPFDASMVDLNTVNEQKFKGNGNVQFPKKNYWHSGTMKGTNKYPEYKNGIYLGGHPKNKKTGKWNSGSFRTATWADQIPRPFLCQVVCPGSKSNYVDYKLDQDAAASSASEEAQEIVEETIQNNNYEEVAWQMPLAANTMIEKYFNASLVEKIQNHGCWCHKLNVYHEDYVGGRETVDDLDYFCKIWFSTRRCTKINEGKCENEHNKGIYKVVDFGNENDCSTLNLNRCALDSCVIDTHFISKMQEFFDFMPDWEPMEGSADICVKGGGSGANAGKKRYCTGTAPDLYIAFED